MAFFFELFFIFPELGSTVLALTKPVFWRIVIFLLKTFFRLASFFHSKSAMARQQLFCFGPSTRNIFGATTSFVLCRRKAVLQRKQSQNWSSETLIEGSQSDRKARYRHRDLSVGNLESVLEHFIRV